MGGAVENVVVVVVDALRADRLGAMGCERELTPNIDDLTAGATVFENAFSCVNTTDPSITSMHTGRFPRTTVYHHGRFVTLDEKRRVESVPRLPGVLQDAGFATVAAGRGIGRWHVEGFDEYPDTDIRGNDRLHAVSDSLERVHPRLQSVAANAFMRLRTLYKRTSNEYSTDVSYAEFYESAVDESEPSPVDRFLRKLDDRDDRRFYGLVHLMDTHTPYLPPPDAVEELLESYDYPDDPVDVPDHQAARAKLTREDYEDGTGVGRIIARYDAAVREADRKVGALVDGLRARGEWEDTALVVLSDHGESLVEHGIFCDHHGLYDETIHVPLVCRVPGAAGTRQPGATGTRVGELVQVPDLMPTVLDLLGVEAGRDPRTTGRSLVPLLGTDGSDTAADAPEGWESRDAVYAEEAHTQRRVAIRTRDWKYVEHETDPRLAEASGDSLRCRYCHTVHGGERELYDLRADPAETENLVEAREAIADRLQGRLHGFLSDLSYPDESTADVEYDDEDAVLQRLEDLGYR